MVKGKYQKQTLPIKSKERKDFNNLKIMDGRETMVLDQCPSMGSRVCVCACLSHLYKKT